MPFSRVLMLSVIVFATASLHDLALAGSISDAKVVAIRVDQDGRGMVSFDKNVTGSPACINAAAYSNALAFDSNTSGGRAILAVAMQARSMGTLITVWAPGTCAIYGGAHVEDWGYGVG